VTARPTVTGFGASRGDGVIDVNLTGPGPWAAGGSMTPKAAVRFAFLLRSVAGEPATEAGLREKLRRQASVIREQQVVLERKNRELDALHYVWCDGACASGVHRWNDALITRELVEAAERNTRRLRRWYRAVEWRMRLPGADAWQRKRYARAAAKTDLAVHTPIGMLDTRELAEAACQAHNAELALKRAAKLVARDWDQRMTGVQIGDGGVRHNVF
jgi:hypothetical protein